MTDPARPDVATANDDDICAIAPEDCNHVARPIRGDVCEIDPAACPKRSINQTGQRYLIFGSSGSDLEFNQLLEAHDLGVELLAKLHRLRVGFEFFEPLLTNLAQHIELAELGRKQHVPPPHEVRLVRSEQPGIITEHRIEFGPQLEQLLNILQCTRRDLNRKLSSKSEAKA